MYETKVYVITKDNMPDAVFKELTKEVMEKYNTDEEKEFAARFRKTNEERWMILEFTSIISYLEKELKWLWDMRIKSNFRPSANKDFFDAGEKVEFKLQIE